MNLTTSEIIDLLGLIPHPTCGFMAPGFRSGLRIPKSVLPAGFDGDREFGGTLYFLVTRDAPVRLHRIRSDQVYHHYIGAPLEVLLLRADGTHEVRTVGPDLVAGMRPELHVPARAFHAARIRSGDYALMGTSVWARAEPSDVELGVAKDLMATYPSANGLIADFTQ